MSDVTPQGLGPLTHAVEGVGTRTSFRRRRWRGPKGVKSAKGLVCSDCGCVCACLASQGWSPVTLCVAKAVCV